MITGAELLWSAQRALLFNIPAYVRFISTELREHGFLMRVYMDRPPSEDDWDMYHGVAAEMTGDFTTLIDANCVVEVFHDNAPYECLPHLKCTIYARYEIDEKMVL
jgi:hypothetical protein